MAIWDQYVCCAHTCATLPHSRHISFGFQFSRMKHDVCSLFWKPQPNKDASEKMMKSGSPCLLWAPLSLLAELMFSFHQEISAKAISDSWMFASKFPLLIFSPSIWSFSIFLYHNGPYFTPGKLSAICPMNLARKRMEQELNVSKDAAVLKILMASMLP